MEEEIIFINKSESDSYPLASVIETFNSSDDLNEIKNVVEKAADRVYVSWASVDAVDNAGEKIPIEDVIKQQEINLRRGGVISNEHTNANVGKTLAYKVMIHPITKTLGVLHLNQIYNDNLRDHQVWNDIVSKKKKGSSVGGVHDVKDSKVMLDDSGSFVKVLSGFSQYETAVTEKPCNKYATIEANSVIAKSDKKMGKEEVKKEDNMVVDEAPVAEEKDTFKEDVMALIGKIGERLDAIEEKISGGASEEEAAEVQESEEEAPEPEKEDVEESEEEEKKPEDETAKSLKAIQKELADLKKSIVKDVIKTERPAQPKAEKEDVMKNIDNKIEDMKKSGKISFKEVGADIRKAQEEALQAKFAN